MVEQSLQEEEEKAEKNCPLRMRKSLTKKERLGNRSDLTRVFGSSLRFNCRGARLVYTENCLSFSRFAVAIVRNYGNAVQRNLSKRILRELFRNNKDRIKKGFDIVVVLFPGDFSFYEREKQFNQLLKRAGLVQDSE